MDRIVVGIDGSAGAERALRWALREAAAHSATLEVVAVHPHADTVGVAGARFPTARPEDLDARTRRELDRFVDDVVDGASGIELVRTVLAGSPAEQLLSRAAEADLLVVGTRGRGGFKGLVLGSVSQQCVNHAVCPVVVVPLGR